MKNVDPTAKIGKISIGELLNNQDYLLIVEIIDNEIDRLHTKHAHDVIKMALTEATNTFGIEVVNDIIEEFELEKFGWKKLKDEYNI